MYEFWYDYVKPKYGDITPYCVVRIQAVSLYTKKQMIFIKDIAEDVELRLILQIMNLTDHCLMEKIKK